MYIDEWFGNDFYRELPLGFHSQSQFVFGQLFWTHTYYPHENLELWRPVFDPGETTRTLAVNFRITPAGKDAFNRNFPLHAPKLETNEEFIVLRAKRRPVILIQPELGLLGVHNKGYKGRVQRRRCLVAQIFGLADPKTARPDFSPSFVDRVRKMEFPQLFFLPRKPGTLDVDSMLRLDELQSVFVPHLDATRFALGEEPSTVLKGQLQYLIAGLGPSEYTVLRQMLLEC